LKSYITLLRQVGRGDLPIPKEPRTPPEHCHAELAGRSTPATPA